jgi:hypothetical protein
MLMVVLSPGDLKDKRGLACGVMLAEPRGVCKGCVLGLRGAISTVDVTEDVKHRARGAAQDMDAGLMVISIQIFHQSQYFGGTLASSDQIVPSDLIYVGWEMDVDIPRDHRGSHPVESQGERAISPLEIEPPLFFGKCGGRQQGAQSAFGRLLTEFQERRKSRRNVSGGEQRPHLHDSSAGCIRPVGTVEDFLHTNQSEV